MELDDLTSAPEEAFVHSFKCARCRLEFALFSRWTERHNAFNVTCPECGNVGAFLHYRAETPRRDEAWPWPGSTRMFDSVVYAVPADADPEQPGDALDHVELSEEFSALHAAQPENPEPPPRRSGSTRSLGQILLANGLLSAERLEVALEQHRSSSRSLGRVLLDIGAIGESDLVRALAEQLDLEFVDLTQRRPDPAATSLLSRTLAERYRAIPIEERDGTLLVAMSDPTNVFALDDLRTITEREVRPVVATAADIEAAIGWLSPSVLEPAASPQRPRPVETEDDQIAELRRALEREEFLLQYLPIVELDSARIWGVEALLRWDDPDAGLLGPIDFLPLAERSGLIVPIGLWVLHRACREGRLLQQASGHRLDISVNVSTRQLEEPDLAQQVARVLGETGLDPRSLILEITETWPVGDFDLAVSTLEDLKSLGVRLAVDNFGCGYASLEYVHRFPIDILKIHGSFVDAVSAGGNSSRLSAAVIELAGILNFERVAVGIERADQVQLLRKLGCDAAEGEYFGRPVPADAMAELLRAKSARADE